MSASDEGYDELEVTDELAQILDAPLDAPAASCLQSLEFGSKAYCGAYKGLLAKVIRENTKLEIDPYDWQLEVRFEKADGFSDLGVDFRKVGFLVQLLAPMDAETLAQRGGRAGRNKDMQADVLVMVQDSLFNDSREGQKRVLKASKQEETALPEQSGQNAGKKALDTAVKKLSAPSKAKRSPREYSKAILDFVNTTGCRMEVLDEEFGNPARPNDSPCLCDNCKHSQGEPTIQDRMQKRSNKRCQPDDEPPATEGAIESQPGPQDSNIDAPDEGSAGKGDEDVATNNPDSGRTRWRSTAKRKPYVDALKQW
ncbi:hypothetical protein FS749_010801 [Ceratobasidium sp. UAMH 11750]|nr:hypothetical protein FS749_010801 [Ceratobasidium sp. UAMH 11750]